MPHTNQRAIAVVGLGAVLPDAPDTATFWDNLTKGRYSITEVLPERWDPALYYDEDRQAPDKLYSTIGGWVRDFEWSPLEWRLPIPPKVSDAMDLTQRWAIAAAREALRDYGYPERPLDTDRTAVVIGNAMGGDKHYLTALRAFFPEYAEELEAAPSFSALPDETRAAIIDELHDGVRQRFPEITEDTMPGELANIIAGRIANLFDLHGSNFVVDAACASAVAAIDAAVEGLEEGDFDAVITGGVDANMSASTFIKFCKIGALSATGTRPYGEGADGFVMGEGAALFLLKRLEDAEAAGDRIYAVIRGLGGASDGKGKGITAPNPIGQTLAVQRAWRNAGLVPDAATYIEGHGTSTKVGDVVEVGSLTDAFADLGLEPGSIPLGSVKSNIGHLKGAAGAAGLLKSVLALYHRQIPPSVGADTPNPNIDFAHSPLAVNTELRDWDAAEGQYRAAGVSAFGFGGTNFHAVLEEYVPGRIHSNGDGDRISVSASSPRVAETALKAPLRGALVVGGADDGEVVARLRATRDAVAEGGAPAPAPPAEADLTAEVRVAIDYGDADELVTRIDKALAAFEGGAPAAWRVLANQGVFLGRGPAHQVAFLYTGQGSQYANMLAELRDREPIVAEVVADADAVMEPLLGSPLSDVIFVDPGDADAMAAAEERLRQTEITQPAVLTVDRALTLLLEAYGIRPDMVMGHSLGEYGALVAAGALPFRHALEAVSARGREMAHVSVDDNGLMAAVFAPLDEIERTIDSVDGYVVVANVNSDNQAVIGGATTAVEAAVAELDAAGHRAVTLPVSHAFHTSIVAPAAEPLTRVLERLDLEPPHLPVVTNVDGQLYPMGPAVVPDMIDILARQVASPVQFVEGLRTLHEAGARVFVEVGPKRALHGFVEDVLGDEDDVVALFTNHPKAGDIVSFNQALCGLYAAGLGVGTRPEPVTPPAPVAAAATTTAPAVTPAAPAAPAAMATTAPALTPGATGDARIHELGRLFADFLEQGYAIYRGSQPDGDGGTPSSSEPVVITGAALGLPGTAEVFDDGNIERLLDGETFIDAIPVALRDAIVDKHITRLVKNESGGGSWEEIASSHDVMKLAGRKGHLDVVEQFGIDPDRQRALDPATELAIGAGIDAMRDAGLPLAMRYKTTSTGSKLPDGWGLPEPVRDDTAVIFASAFPGVDRLVDEVSRYEQDRGRHDRLEALEHLRSRMGDDNPAAPELDHMIHELRADLEQEAYAFDRRFLFKALSMGHAQFAEHIRARGPNTQINAACASTTQAVALAEDWIRLGRCRRVIVISGDDVTTDTLIEWIGAGFLSTGAAATDDVVEEAALPFDRRRHGMLLGMGGAAIVVETAEAARERGIRPICEVLGTVTANSAFHGSRLDVTHIRHVMEQLVAGAEQRWGIDRNEIAPATVFVSHETYTPARGGSAQAEVDALRHVFGDAADDIVIANTKGFTGHAMGAGIEDVLAVKTLETGLVPPIANVKEIDPDLGNLNLSKGGAYPVTYALRLGAGFGSQISMSLMRWVPSPDRSHREPDELGHGYRIDDPEAWTRWLTEVSGYPSPAVEVDHRTFRIRDDGPPAGVVPTARPVVASAPAVVSAPVPAPTPEPVAAPVAPPPAATAPAAPAPVAPEPAAPAATEDEVASVVVGIVADQTGYPADMLDLDLDLEADLGIDTVKQAETFAAIREHYGIERDDTLSLRDYPTLDHVIGFVRERAQNLAPAAPTAPAAPATEAAPAAAAATEDDVTAVVVGIVADQTGYPADMLDLDLDLEADLGIDTVKQAETFAAIREHYGIERDDTLSLRDYPTLDHVIGFVRDRAQNLAPTAPTAPAAEAAPAAAVAPALAGDDEAAAALPRRVPTPTLRLSPELFVPTGIELGSDDRVVVMLDTGGVGAALVDRLTARDVDVLAVEGAPDADELLARIDQWRGDGHVTGVFWLPALDVENPTAELDLAAWREGLRHRVKLLYRTLRHLDAQYEAAGRFLIAATRLGGLHGYGADGASAPMGGAVVGLAKSFRRERPDVLVKAVDFEVSRKTAALADLLIDETRQDPGVVEVGYHDDLRHTIALQETGLAETPSGLELGPDSVFVVTGAAGAIVSAIIADLAEASGGVFHLLDLVPEPDPADPDLVAFDADRDALKREIFDRLGSGGDRVTPVMVERELARIERAHDALAALQAVAAHGGTAHWHQVDLRDADAVGKVTAAIAGEHDRVDALVHAAGLEISRRLAEKEPAEYDLVFDVKADGWFNLMAGLGSVPIGATVVFSSVAGRFGNAGQADYSAANDLLCKATAAVGRERPETFGIALDWTAWGDIGMATRGSIPTVMAAAGIDMLPAAAGIPVVRRELTGEAASREVVVGLRLGMLTDEWHPAGGLAPEALSPSADRQPLVAEVTGMTLAEGLTVAISLDPTEHPFLDDHRIDGTPVLPGVMGMELFAETATLPFAERHVAAIEDVDFLAPFKFFRDEPRTLQVSARYRADGDDIVADCVLAGERAIAGQDEPQRTVHFTGRVRLATSPPAAASTDPPGSGEVVVAADDIYGIYFHGPAYQVLAEAWRADGAVVGRMTPDLPPAERDGGTAPTTGPRLTELCFQTAGVWEIATTGVMALPTHIDRVVPVAADEASAGSAHAVVRPRDGAGVDAVVVDGEGTVLLQLEGYRTIPLPGQLEDQQVAPLRAAMVES